MNSSSASSVVSKYRANPTFAEVKSDGPKGAAVIRRPEKTDWITVNPDPAYMIDYLAVIVSRDSNTTYVLAPEIIPLVPRREYEMVSLYTAVTSTDTTFLMPVRHGEDTWALSLQKAVELAMGSWVRIVSNRKADRYETVSPISVLAKPAWPDTPFEQLIETAFQDVLIDSLSHRVLRNLSGQF